jgi:uncharacterized membrane protein YgcG
MQFLIRRIIEKVKHAHTYDNSELDDLFKDILTRQPLTLLQKFKRKMKYALKTLVYFITVFAVMTVFGSNAFATDIPSRPDRGWYVRDVANKMSQYQIRNLNLKIENFNRTTRNEIGVLIMPPLSDDTNLENFAHDTFHSWGIGKAGLDNGILILVVSGGPGHKFMRIETGKGAEGDVSDSKVKEITTAMKPSLKNDDYYGAVNVAIETIMSLMESRVGVKPIVGHTTPGADLNTPTNSPTSSPGNSYSNNDATGPNDWTPLLWLFGFFVFITLAIILGSWWSTRSVVRVVRKKGAVRDDPYIPPPPPRHNTMYTPQKHTTSTISSGPAAVIATATVVSAAQTRREAQARADEARKARDRARRPSPTSTYVSRRDDDGGSWGGGDSGGGSWGGGGDSGGGFGGGDSGGGGGSDSC